MIRALVPRWGVVKGFFLFGVGLKGIPFSRFLVRGILGFTWSGEPSVGSVMWLMCSRNVP